MGRGREIQEKKYQRWGKEDDKKLFHLLNQHVYNL